MSCPTEFNLTELIDWCMSENRYNEYEFNAERTELWLGMVGYGDSVDYLLDEDDLDSWQEDMFLTQGFYPLQDDENVEDILDEVTPTRTHDYKTACLQFWLDLPPNRKRGTRYSVSEIRSWIRCADGWGDDNPGMGFSYYNMPETDEDE